MIPVDDALAIVTGAVAPLPIEVVSLGDALGRVLAAPVHSTFPLPPFDQSAVDGYAARHADIARVPVTLPVKGVVAARAYDKRPFLDLGTLMRIFTGGVVPEGADTIVRQEATEPGGDERWTVTQEIALGTDLRRAGEELAAGTQIAAAGARVTPGMIGALDDNRLVPFLDALDRHHAVGTVRHDASGGDCHCLTGSERPRRRMPRRNAGDDRERPRRVGGAEREAVHRGRVERRQRDLGDDVLRDHAA